MQRRSRRTDNPYILNRTWRNFRADFNVEQLEIRFNLEDEYLANGLSIRKKAFSLRFIAQRSVSQKHIGANIILSHPLLS